jgi:predicted enzyme related to lactoylglutathione lyase
VLEPSSSDEPQITHFGLELVEPADLERAIALAVAGGGRLLERADHLVGGSSAVIADPSGHRISL